jgi:hypothetical protein
MLCIREAQVFPSLNSSRPPKSVEISNSVAFLVMCAEENLGAAPHLFCLIYACIHTWRESFSLGRAFRIIVLTQPSESVVRA